MGRVEFAPSLLHRRNCAVAASPPQLRCRRFTAAFAPRGAPTGRCGSLDVAKHPRDGARVGAAQAANGACGIRAVAALPP